MIYEYTNDLPIVTVSLYHAGQNITIHAVVDSGAMVSLPYEYGVELGLIWEEQTLPVRLGGAGQGVPAFGVLVRGEMTGIPPVALAFAWTRKTREEIRPWLPTSYIRRQAGKTDGVSLGLRRARPSGRLTPVVR